MPIFTDAVTEGDRHVIVSRDCHAPGYDRIGPRRCGLIGRHADTVRGFAYSRSVKTSAIVWNAGTLDRFLAEPSRTVRGTTMTYACVPETRERADLIAYLTRAGNSARECGVAE